MAETVIILGAGASQQAGAPLMKDFLKTAEKFENSRDVEDIAEEFHLVFEAIGSLQGALIKGNLDIDNLESVFSAFEMAELLERLGSFPPEKIRKLPRAMRVLIARTLELSVDFPRPPDEVLFRPPDPYHELMELIGAAAGPAQATKPRLEQEKVSIITFNYDLCLDYAFRWKRMVVNYCLDDDHAGLKLLKLHGSLNWIYCPECDRISAWHLSDFFDGHSWELKLKKPTVAQLHILRRLGEFEHKPGSCSFRADEPMLVPPSWNKSPYHHHLRRVWQAAARELANAENIFICGYSFPETDEFFRYFFALATAGETRLRRLYVFDRDEAVEKRFLAVLGPLAKKRFEFRKAFFEQAVILIGYALKIPGFLEKVRTASLPFSAPE